MKRWLRRIRGAIGMGLTWALAWFGVGMLVLLAIFASDAQGADVPFPLFWGLLGFLAGISFSAILGTVERRRSLDQMSVSRFAVWGAIAGLLLSGGLIWVGGLAGEALLLGPLFALSGAGCAAGSFVLAKRANDRESRGLTSGLANEEVTEAQ